MNLEVLLTRQGHVNCSEYSLIDSKTIKFKCPKEVPGSSDKISIKLTFGYPMTTIQTLVEIKPKIYNLASNSELSDEAGTSSLGTQVKSNRLKALIDARDSTVLGIDTLQMESKIKYSKPIQNCRILITLEEKYFINFLLLRVKGKIK